MTYASPAIDLRATKADRKRGVLMAGGAALALGSIGVTVTSVLYALSPPAAALPAYPLDLALAGARSGASTLHAAGTVGIFSDIVMAVGVLLVAFELVQRERARRGGRLDRHVLEHCRVYVCRCDRRLRARAAGRA